MLGSECSSSEEFSSSSGRNKPLLALRVKGQKMGEAGWGAAGSSLTRLLCSPRGFVEAVSFSSAQKRERGVGNGAKSGGWIQHQVNSALSFLGEEFSH